MAAKKTDFDGYLIDGNGVRVLTASGEPIRVKVPKKYNDAGQQIDDNGNLVLGRDGKPKYKPVRNPGQRAVGVALRKRVDMVNSTLELARTMGLKFDFDYKDGVISLTNMQIVETL